MAANGTAWAHIGDTYDSLLEVASYCHVVVAEGCRHVALVGGVYRGIGLACSERVLVKVAFGGLLSVTTFFAHFAAR